MSQYNRSPGASPSAEACPELWAIGRLAPTNRVERITLRRTGGSYTRSLMKSLGGRFIGGDDPPAVVDGLEWLTNPLIVADPGNVANWASKVLRLTQRLNDEQAAKLQEIVGLVARPRLTGPNAVSPGTAPEHAPGAEWAGRSPGGENVAEAVDRIRALADMLPSVVSVLPIGGATEDFAKVANRLYDLFHTLSKWTAGVMRPIAEQAVHTANAGAVALANDIRAKTQPYRTSWAGLHALGHISQGAAPEVIEVINCPDPEGLLAHDPDLLFEYLSRSRKPSIDILCLEPLRDLASLDQLDPYLGETPTALATLICSFVGYSDLKDLLEVADEYPARGTVGAGSVWVGAGKASYQGIAMGVAPLYMSVRHKLDAYRIPGERGAYGMATPSFGAHSAKAISGITELDTEHWFDFRHTLAKARLNCMVRNRRNALSFASGKSRSLLPDYSQTDLVRLGLSALGMATQYIEDESEGELGDPTIRRGIAKEAEALAFGRFCHVPGLSGQIELVKGDANGEVRARINATWPDAIERVVADFKRNSPNLSDRRAAKVGA